MIEIHNDQREKLGASAQDYKEKPLDQLAEKLELVAKSLSSSLPSEISYERQPAFCLQGNLSGKD